MCAVTLRHQQAQTPCLGPDSSPHTPCLLHADWLQGCRLHSCRFSVRTVRARRSAEPQERTWRRVSVCLYVSMCSCSCTGPLQLGVQEEEVWVEETHLHLQETPGGTSCMHIQASRLQRCVRRTRTELRSKHLRSGPEDSRVSPFVLCGQTKMKRL